MNLELQNLSELRKKLDAKEVSSVELTESFLKSIEESKDLNAFITVAADEARTAAKAADEHIAAPGENPSLCGIPYAAKDLFCTLGVRTTAASNILGNYVPPYDSTVQKKLKLHKAVLLGKANLDQFAHGSSGETSAFGPTKNPWDESRMPGGSSSGSAAAVAAGLCAFATATETGGSIRQPSSLTGISGWKPTYGRVSRYGVIAMGSSLDSPGAMGRSVEDLALVAEAIAGQDECDSTTSPIAVPSYHKNLSASVKGLRVGVPKQYFVDGMEDGVRVAVDLALKELEAAGAVLVPVDLPNTRYGSLVYAIIAPSEISSNLGRFDGIRYGHTTKEAKDLFEVYAKSRAEGFGNEAKRRIMMGTYVLSAGYYDAYYKKAQKVRRLIIDEFAEVFKTVDVLACPSSPNVALGLGKAAEDPLFGYIADQLNIPSSLAGLPAVSVPCGFAAPKDGASVQLPVGLQIIGPQFGEQKVFDTGFAFQRLTDWHTKTPDTK